MSVSIVIGDLRHEARVYGASTKTPDGDGGYTEARVALSPPIWRFAVQQPNSRSAERRFSATVIAQASYMFSGRWHPQIDIDSTLTWVDRGGVTHTGSVLDVDDTDGVGVETVIMVSEIVS